MSAVMQPIAERVAVGLTTSEGFELSQRAAKLMAASTLMPDTFRGNLPNCAIALNLAARLGADPLLVAQNLYVVHGRPAWSSQFLIATWNQCGRFAPIRYEFFGDKGTDGYGCRAISKELSSGEPIIGPDVTIGLAKEEGWYNRNGSKWKTGLRDLMLRYRAATFLIRTTAPELSMGLHTAEEMHDVYDAARGPSGDYEVQPAPVVDINARLRAESVPQETVDTTTGEIIEPAAPGDAGADEYADWIAAIEEKTSVGDLAELIRAMDQETRKALRPVIEKKQAEIQAK